jgi:hypothetical protein
MADLSFGKMAGALEGSTYVAVGFGVLAFQRAQVRRRELQRQIGQLTQTLSDTLGHSSESFPDSLTENMPKDARVLLIAAAELAQDLPREATEIVKEALAIGRLMVKMRPVPGGRG